MWIETTFAIAENTFGGW